jgi:hypothetical protein
MMNVLTAKHAGIALAALLRGDGHRTEAQRGLAPELSHALMRPLAAIGREDRHRRVTALLAQVRPPLAAHVAGLPPRLRALIAPRLPTTAAREMLREGPPPRSGFTLPRALLPRLLRIARHHQERAHP